MRSMEADMKKVVILGCENSHAGGFLKNFKGKEEFSDIEVVGVYSYDREAAKKLSDTYGVKIMESFDEAVGEVDGVIITARHGSNHYKYAKPYIASGVPMFIDKPITENGGEAVELMRALKDAGIRFCGGSILPLDKRLIEIARRVREEEGGKTVGGFVRAPIDIKSEYGGFYFYAQHLVEMVCAVFGYYPDYVSAAMSDKAVTAVIEYGDIHVTAHFIEKSYKYYIGRFTDKDTEMIDISDDPADERTYTEVSEFCEMIRGGKGRESREDFIAPVFVMDAIVEAYESGRRVAVKKYCV